MGVGSQLVTIKSKFKMGVALICGCCFLLCVVAIAVSFPVAQSEENAARSINLYTPVDFGGEEPPDTVRLHMRGVFLGYRRSLTHQKPSTALVKIEHVESK